MKGKKPILIVLALVVFFLVGVWASRGAESKLSHSLAIAKLLHPLPELSRTAGTLTEGSLTILLARDRVASMEVSIQGRINALIASIPMKLTAGFHFA